MVTLEEKNMHVTQAVADADLRIVQAAMFSNSNLSKKVVIVCSDTDVLVLLNHLHRGEKTIYFYKPAQGASAEPWVYSNNSFAMKYPNATRYLLVLHAFTGCDTTCGYFDRQKKNLFKNLRSQKNYLITRIPLCCQIKVKTKSLKQEQNSF